MTGPTAASQLTRIGVQSCRPDIMLIVSLLRTLIVSLLATHNDSIDGPGIIIAMDASQSNESSGYCRLQVVFSMLRYAGKPFKSHAIVDQIDQRFLILQQDGTAALVQGSRRVGQGINLAW